MKRSEFVFSLSMQFLQGDNEMIKYEIILAISPQSSASQLDQPINREIIRNTLMCILYIYLFVTSYSQ